MLRVRLEELGDIVDYFIIVEANETFTGKTKPFYLDELPEWADKWKDKIVKVKIYFDSPELLHLKSAWEKEYHQRNAIVDGLALVDAQSEDIIIISDADEIIRGSVAKQIHTISSPVRLDVYQYFWSYNWRAPQHCNQGARPVACRYKHLQSMTCQELRARSWSTVDEAGWHFSFFTDVENIKNKIESFAHTEYDTDEYKDSQQILNRIKNGIDPFDRFPLKYYEVDGTYPSWVYKNFG